jgi:predicted transcriptional regulator
MSSRRSASISSGAQGFMTPLPSAEMVLRNGAEPTYVRIIVCESETPMAETATNPDLLGLTAEIVAAHVSNNSVALSDLPNLIQDVYRTLAHVGQPQPTVPERPQPAVPIKKSITPEYLICLEDGKKLKMLKRHLKTAYNLSPEQYRERWGLAPDYPMVAPNYAKHRSTLAKKIGLGTKPRGRPARGGRAAAAATHSPGKTG